MKRRDFIKRSAVASVSAIVLPSIFTTSCAKEPVLPKSGFSGKVLIIGAGAAGLYAGYTLKRGGYDFQILEASDRIGGRMGKDSTFADHTIDLGAQWLHGNKSIAADLADIHDVAFSKDNSEIFFYINGGLTDKLNSDPTKIFGDKDSPDISFLEYAHNEGFGNEHDMIVEAAAGDFGADSTDISVKWSAIEEEDWDSGNKDYKFEKSYWDLLNDHVASEISDHIILNSVISSIDYSGDQVLVTDSNNNLYEGDKVIITVPITVLKDQDIQFIPVLPQEKIEAFQKIGMGPGMKVFLKFSEKFYKGNTVGGSVCAAYVDDKEGKTGTDHVLLAFIMGSQAKALSDLGTDQAIVDVLLNELDVIYNGKASTSFLAAKVIDFTTMPFIRGAYSYARIGTGEVRETMALTLSNKLYFAGEAMNTNGHHQTAHGAMETGYNKVVEILENA